MAEMASTSPGSRAQPRESDMPHVSFFHGAAMILFALGFDGLQFLAMFFHAFHAADFIPFLGPIIGFLGSAIAIVVAWLIGVIAQIIFALWFMLVVHADGGAARTAFATRLLIYMSMFIAEMVPFINALPAITLGVFALIVLTNLEARAGAPARSLRLSQVRSGIMSQMPLMRFVGGAAQPLANATAAAQGTRGGNTLESMRQRQMTKAGDVDLSRARFTGNAERYARRYGQRQTDARVARGNKQRDLDRGFEQF